MRNVRLTQAAAAAAVALALTTVPTAAQTPQRDKEAWRAIAASKFSVPAGTTAAALAHDLSALLASPDPELRDDIGYTGLVSLIYRQRALSDGDLRALMHAWLRNLRSGIGEEGTDSIFRRSFSALSLGLIAALDNEAPFLDRDEFNRLLAAAIDYLAAERDVRGFDAARGWMHSVAHTADLLKFLARSRHLRPAQQAAILTGIADKVGAVDVVLTHGEDERLARAVVSIAARGDFDRAGLERWLAALASSKPATPPTPASLAAAQNRRNLVVSLHAVLTTDQRTSPGLDAARTIVRTALKQFVQ